MHGATTFFADGMDRKSVIDYVLASPDLIHCPGVDLTVTPQHLGPLRPRGKKFDHMPITLRIPNTYLSPDQDCGNTHDLGNLIQKRIWHDKHSHKYSSIIKNDPEIKRLLKCAVDGLFMEETEEAISTALDIAISKCIPRSGCSPTARRKQGPTNAWFDDECKTARKAVRLVESQNGCTSNQAEVANKIYKALLRKKKRRWLESSMEELQLNLKRDPKNFWNKIHGPNKGASPDISLSEWTSYFTELFDTQMDLNSVAHAGSFVNLADGPHTEAVPTWLCQDFTPEEVFDVIHNLRKNSSPGVDGIPAEWFKFATNKSDSLFVQALTNLFNLILKNSYPSH